MSLSSRPRLIHIASGTEPRVKSEEIRFESPYSESKFIGTSAVQLAQDKGDVDARIIRVHNCYGKGQPTDRFVSWAASKLSKQEEISIRYPERIRDFCLVSEAAQKISEIAISDDESSDSIVVEVGTGLGLTLKNVALKICETLNVKSSLVTNLNGDLEDPHPVEVAETQGDTAGVCKIEFHEGIQKTLGGL
jgi:nucleoside-diphosphate-sugar epimerase